MIKKKKEDRKISGKKKTGHYRTIVVFSGLIAAVSIVTVFFMTGIKGESQEKPKWFQKLYADVEDEKEIEDIKKRTEKEEKSKTEEQTDTKDDQHDKTSQPDHKTEEQTPSQPEGRTEEQGTTQKEDTPDQPTAAPDSYEIHLMLNSDLVLDDNHLLIPAVCSFFKADEDYKSFAVAYYETSGRLFNQEGWINRIRMREDKPKKGFKLTFKKRYPVSGSDINASMVKAQSDGFELSDKNLSKQVEWNYSGMVLSLSTDADCDTGKRKIMDDLSLEDALTMLQDNMPAIEQNWKSEHWGVNTLQSARMGGPVRFKRYTGTYQGEEVDIEVWTIPDPQSGNNRYITEVSFKEENYEKAALVRTQLIDVLKEQGVLLEKDSLKTQQILDIFFPVE